jgi:zinc protease
MSTRVLSRAGRQLACCALLLAALASPVPAQDGVIDIPHKRFVLPNGLTLIVHEDRKAPIVAVNVWYHVGSKNERPGRTGFAHLFEHLMFNGTEHYNDDYFKVLERIGATNLNGTTNSDRTNYFQDVPTTALDSVLWMESDRMGHLLGVIDQPRLDEQRGVVQNEKRQGDNQPYGRLQYTVLENLFPAGHPYSWSVIGSMEDLSAATLEDARTWFRTYYGAANAVLVVAGDIDAETARRKVEQYFGHIPAGPPVTRLEAWVPRRTGETRVRLEDEKAPQPAFVKAWVTPQDGTADADYLGMVASVLASGKTSRLYKRLVYDEQIATDVAAFAMPMELAGITRIQVFVRPGGDLGRVERAVNEEIARFLAGGPTADELERVIAQRRAAFVRGVERIGGFGGKSDVLARSEVLLGSPDAHKVAQQRQLTATAADLQGAASRWMSDGALVVEVVPYPKYQTVTSTVDRTRLPDAGTPPAPVFPGFERATLSNGLKVIVAERRTVPTVNLNLIVDAGYAADAPAGPGTASLALDMMDEGAGARNALQISDELGRLGANLSTGSGLDVSSVSMSALRSNLDASLALYADVVLAPTFPADELDRLKPRRLAQIAREGTQPEAVGLRVLPRLMYGESHAYGVPFTGSGYAAVVAKLSREDLAAFHRAWFKPNNATLVVVGDTTRAEIVPRLEKLFGAWKAGEAPKKNIAAVAVPARPAVYLLDQPGSVQSVIFAGHVAPPKGAADTLALETLNTLLGGTFTSRINMNLREDKHWSYGARSSLVDARGQRPFFVNAPVQSDKTAEAMREIAKELRGVVGPAPATPDEVDKAKKARTLTLPGRWETAAAVAGSLGEMVTFGYPDDYFATYASRIDALTPAQVQKTASSIVPDGLVWLVVGDRGKIEAGIRELNLGPVSVVDADGRVVGGTN